MQNVSRGLHTQKGPLCVREDAHVGWQRQRVPSISGSDRSYVTSWDRNRLGCLWRHVLFQKCNGTKDNWKGTVWKSLHQSTDDDSGDCFFPCQRSEDLFWLHHSMKLSSLRTSDKMIPEGTTLNSPLTLWTQWWATPNFMAVHPKVIEPGLNQLTDPQCQL